MYKTPKRKYELPKLVILENKKKKNIKEDSDDEIVPDNDGVSMTIEMDSTLICINHMKVDIMRKDDLPNKKGKIIITGDPSGGFGIGKTILYKDSKYSIMKKNVFFEIENNKIHYKYKGFEFNFE